MKYLARFQKVKVKSKLHPEDWRNFRVKKHWHGIHHYTKKIRKGYQATMKDDIECSIFSEYGNVTHGSRFRMRCRARYQTWGWYCNNLIYR